MKFETETIYIQLLDEGTYSWRPTKGIKLREGIYKVLPIDNYDPELEEWEFVPWTIVKCEFEKKSSGKLILVAKSKVEDPSESSNNSA